jgi:hypothetical protein
MAEVALDAQHEPAALQIGAGLAAADKARAAIKDVVFSVERIAPGRAIDAAADVPANIEAGPAENRGGSRSDRRNRQRSRRYRQIRRCYRNNGKAGSSGKYDACNNRTQLHLPWHPRPGRAYATRATKAVVDLAPQKARGVRTKRGATVAGK